MLNFFNSFTVPGVEYVTMFHDDTEDDLFYMLPELPSLVRRQDGSPSFHLLAFARDFTLMADEATQLPAGELEGGLMSMTTQLVVSAEDQEKIRTYLQGGQSGGLRPRFDGTRIMLARFVAPTTPVRLAYPTFVDGSVQFGILPGDAPTFVKGTSASAKPSLNGSNMANYTALLGQEGVRLMRGAAAGGALEATVDYRLQFVARIPAVSVHVYGNMSDIYQELKEHCTVNEHYQDSSKSITWTYPAVSSLHELKTMVTNLHVDIDDQDFRSANEGGDDVSAKVQEMALKLVESQILPRFFNTGLTPGLKVDRLGTDPRAGLPGHEGPPKPANQLWLKDFTQEMSGSIDVSFNSSANITVDRGAQCSLLTLLTPADLKSCITEADLSQPYFDLLDVPVRVTADFEHDPIAAVKVFLDYDQKDDRSGQVKKKTEEFLFQGPDQVFYFRTIMARDAENRPKDTYRYKSQVIYKATAATEDVPEVETRERSLLVGYDKLDCVNVKVVLGAMPVGLVARTQVHFRYPGVTSPTSEADVILTDIGTEGRWFTYTGGSESREYEYQTTFFMADGQQLVMPVEKSVSESLIINAPFRDRLKTIFIAQGLFPPLANVIVSTRYRDEANDYDVNDAVSLTTSGQAWTWEVDLRDKAKRDFEYKVDITYADGSSATQEWTPGEEGTINVGQVNRQLLKIEVVPTLVDFTKWKLVLVRLAYADPANGVSLTHDVQLTPTNQAPPERFWEVPIKDAGATSFTWSVQAFGVDGSKSEVPATTTVDPLVLIQV